MTGEEESTTNYIKLVVVSASGQGIVQNIVGEKSGNFIFEFEWEPCYVAVVEKYFTSCPQGSKSNVFDGNFKSCSGMSMKFGCVWLHRSVLTVCVKTIHFT